MCGTAATDPDSLGPGGRSAAGTLSLVSCPSRTQASGLRGHRGCCFLPLTARFRGDSAVAKAPSSRSRADSAFALWGFLARRARP